VKKRSGYNPKRKVASADSDSRGQGRGLAQRAVYKGNPVHKRRPEDYGLSPPAEPRPGKTLCDADGEFPKAKAERLLREGLAKGVFSCQRRDGWPQNVWAVGEDGEVFEAQLENRGQGHYHGYPMPPDDEFRSTVKREWMRR